uniref:Large ribosomal subunit protein uL2 RNA-binding domain-containing protein n=1 Tax=Lactuca sativa TaxID=4236 RepID=A0A9R1XN49_LACSA|nr:hypothetical protein LSAT_V11C300132890 [Lactuca sativa]
MLKGIGSHLRQISVFEVSTLLGYWISQSVNLVTVMPKTRAQNVSSERPLRQFVIGKDKSAVGVVERIEYDPNRTSRIAVVRWFEGATVDRSKKVNSLQKNFTPPPKILPSISIKGQFSFSSIPGMLEDKNVESLRPKTDHVAVGLSKGSRTLSSQSQS